MKTQRVVSVVAWGLGAILLVPASASTASALGPTADDATALEGSQCWGRCSACTTRCASIPGTDRAACERTCQAGNDACCEGSGRHGAPRACGCY
jgi:hypothetical protein